jgi:hypothetical protein
MKIQQENQQQTIAVQRTIPWVRRWRPGIGMALLLMALFTGLFSGRGVYAHDDVVVNADGTRHAPVEISLSADRAPGPGEVVNLLLTVTSHTATPTMALQWRLDNGGELLGGPAAETLTNVLSHQPVQMSRQVRFATAGIYQVTVAAQIQPVAAVGYGAADVLFLLSRRTVPPP